VGFPKSELTQMFRAVDAVEELRGAGIAFIGDRQCSVLRDSMHSSRLQTFVILYEMEDDTEYEAAQQGTRPRRILSELAQLGFNCGAAGLTGFVAVASTGATPFTVGASTPVMYLSTAAFIATSIQCGNSMWRTGAEIWNPAHLEALDSSEWYTNTSTALDAISLLGVGAASTSAIRTVLLVRKASGRPIMEILRGMSRAERKRLAQEVARLEVPGISNKKLKVLMRMGAHARIYRNYELVPALRLKLLDGLAASLSFGSSLLGGNVGTLAIYLYQEE